MVSERDTPQRVMSDADSALYAAKASGRNLVVTYVEVPHAELAVDA